MHDLMKQGESFFSQGKIVEAERCFLDTLEQDSQNKVAYNNLGVISFQAQKIDKAIDYFNKSLKIDPFYKDAILNYSSLLRELNLFYKAIPFLEKIIVRYPDDNEFKRLLDEAYAVSSSKKKITILCLPGQDSFMGEIVGFLKTDYEVLTCYSNDDQEIEGMKKVFADLKKQGEEYIIKISYILTPVETEESLEETFRMMRSLQDLETNKLHIQVFWQLIIPYAGTQVMREHTDLVAHPYFFGKDFEAWNKKAVLKRYPKSVYHTFPKRFSGRRYNEIPE